MKKVMIFSLWKQGVVIKFSNFYEKVFFHIQIYLAVTTFAARKVVKTCDHNLSDAKRSRDLEIGFVLFLTIKLYTYFLTLSNLLVL
ncbi:hypothetical protein P8452_21955 [Trifolium repens]|nr:hypothetical protein P8452_21955 [Trifolium repens]